MRQLLYIQRPTSSKKLQMNSFEATISLRAAYEADMAKAIDTAREECRALFQNEICRSELFLPDTDTWLGPKNNAIRHEARKCLDYLPPVLINIILNEYGDFIDFERFKIALPEVMLPDTGRVLFQSVLMMAIGTDNFELFDALNTYYTKRPWSYMSQSEYFMEFCEFIYILEHRMDMFKGTMRNLIYYLGRGDRWVSSIRFGPGSPLTNLRYALMGSGPVDEVKKIVESSRRIKLYARDDFIAIAMSGDANPEIIEFILSFT
jgi:hypothetical protein